MWAEFILRVGRSGLLTVILSLVLLVNCRASEIICNNGLFDDISYSEEVARATWPSGFRPTEGQCRRAVLSGRIENGDFEKVVEFYRPNHRVLREIAVISVGGDVDEAIRIGHFLRQYQIRIEAPSAFSDPIAPGKIYTDADGYCREKRVQSCICASACALIFYGSPLHRGSVGLHRPRLEDDAFKNMGFAEASKLYTHELQSIDNFLRESEAPQSVIDIFNRTSSGNIAWVHQDDENDKTPSFEEWVDATCKSKRPTAVSHEMARHLRYLKQVGQQSPQQNAELTDIEAKNNIYDNCAFVLTTSHVDQMPPP